MKPIETFPLIAITEVLAMASGDAATGLYGDDAYTVEDILASKLDDIYSCDDYREWRDNPDWRQTTPVIITTIDGNSLFLNGHHRVAKARELGILFLHYTDDWKMTL